MVNEESDWSDTLEKKRRREEKWGKELLNSLSTGAFCATKEIGFVALNLISFGKIWLAGPTTLGPNSHGFGAPNFWS